MATLEEKVHVQTSEANWRDKLARNSESVCIFTDDSSGRKINVVRIKRTS